MSDVSGYRWQNLPLPEPHLGLLTGGLILHRFRPWTLHAEGRLRLATGWALIVIGVALAGWATRTAGNTELAQPNRLVTGGPYAISRHPMYMGWHCLYLGVALVANSRWPIILAPLLAALVHRTVLAEEQRLERRFGDVYRAYRRQVRRYL